MGLRDNPAESTMRALRATRPMWYTPRKTVGPY